METPSSEASASVKPAQLLWTYELSRINDIMRSHLQAKKSEAENVGNLTRLLRTFTKDVMLLQISMNTTYGESACSRSQQLNHLYPQFRLASKSAQDALTALQTALGHHENYHVIDQFLGCMMDLVEVTRELYKVFTDNRETLARETQSEENAETKQSALECPHDLKSSDRTSPTIKTEEGDESKCSQFPSTPTIEDLQAQNGRSLEEYFKDAKTLRRKLRQSNEFDISSFISLFIDGLDKKIYRRRIIHILRKETWTWGWLKHMAIFIILEEQYFEKQAYALAHQQEDGSVILPDGTKQKRFVVIEPITEEDLSASEEE
ncbi:uncharacterized protein N7483_012034 [Penicillium malachiteum]|uniref:uncharacterized protein n=1 Tax=Penicillium malachiteum TaxID=1324776 RepID=UPI0025484A78|nr:uncharacterized protein N7483_012034 [Penicillium malachiteum]KAJ5714853.1 hypothetical protein N7483_012034 [Penicillium malachiteum]